MAQLKDSVVSGNLRVTDTTLTDTLQVTTVKAILDPSASQPTYGPGSNGQVLKTNGSTVYWGSDTSSDLRVRQTLYTTSALHPLLLSNAQTSSSTSNVDNYTYRSNAIYANPNTAAIYANYMYAGGAESQSAYPAGGYHVYDCRSVNVTPANGDKTANFYFHMTDTPDTSKWWSVMHVKGWTGPHSAWEIAGPAHNSDQKTTPLYVRTSNASTAWGSWRKIYDTANKPTASELGFGTIVTHAEGDYVPNTNAGVNAAINLLSTGTSTPSLSDYYISQWAGGTETTYHRRPISALWDAFKGLITLVTTGSGNAVTDVSIANDGDHNRKITVTKGSTFSLSNHNHDSDYVKTAYNQGTYNTNYGILFTDPITASTDTGGYAYRNAEIRAKFRPPATSARGWAEIYLGNAETTNATGSTGWIGLYNSSGKLTDLGVADGSSDTVQYFPNTSGTILNSGTTSYTQTVASSVAGVYEIGKIKINGTPTTIYGHDVNTTYTIGTSGNNVTLTPSSGSVQSITVPYATKAQYPMVIATNELRLYNDNQFKADNHFWIGYEWAPGSHYTPTGGTDTPSTIAPNITKYFMGNCSSGGLASVHAKTFILGNGSSPTSGSTTTTIVTAATTTRTITLPDESGTVSLEGHTHNYVPNTAGGVIDAINLLDIGNDQPAISDYYISQYAQGSTLPSDDPNYYRRNYFYRRPLSSLWGTFRELITISTTGSGNAITSVSIANDDSTASSPKRKITFTKGSTFLASTTKYAGSSSVGGPALSLYTDIIDDTAGSHATVLQTYFNANKSTIPRDKVLGYYSRRSSNGSIYMGYFLHEYDSNPYGGFFVAHYNTPYYVGISNGTYTEQEILTSTNYTSYALPTTTKYAGSSSVGGPANLLAYRHQNEINFSGGKKTTCYFNYRDADTDAEDTGETPISIDYRFCDYRNSTAYTTITAANFAGNASTATKWKTARTLTIGSTGKSVDGSGNVSWSLSEIGAAAASHTHDSLEMKTLTASTIDTTAGTYGFKGTGLLGNSNADWAGFQVDASNDRFQLTANSQLLFRQNDETTMAGNWSAWVGCITPNNVSATSGIKVTKTTSSIGTGDGSLTYYSGVKIEHDVSTSTDTTNTGTLSHGGTFTAITSVTRDSYGHVKTLNTKTYTLPGSGDTDTKVTQTAVGSTYTNYRPLVISASNADSAPPTATTVTDGTFITSSIYCQPSSGSVYATKFIGPLQGNADTATNATNADNVYGTVTNGTTTTARYGVVFAADPNTSENNTMRKTYDFRINLTNGSTSTTGMAELVLGNEKAKNTADNKQGSLTLYSPGTSYHQIYAAETNSAIAHTFPATSGTILNSGTTSFTQTLTSGTKIGSIKINGTSTDIYAPTNTDANVTQTATTTNANYEVLFSATADNTTRTETARKNSNLKFNPSTGSLYTSKYYGEFECLNEVGNTSYAMVLAVNPDTHQPNTLRKTPNAIISFKSGTASEEGWAQITLGNETKSGTAGNSTGWLKLFSPSSGYHYITGTSTTSAITHTLPAVSGTVLNSGNYLQYTRSIQKLYAATSTKGWRRILTIPAMNSSGYTIGRYEFHFTRQWNNGAPESFGVRVICNYNTPIIRLLYAEQYTRILTDFRVTRSSDSTKIHFEVWYDATNKNDFSVRYVIQDPDRVPHDYCTFPTETDGSSPGSSFLPVVSDSPTAQATIVIPTGGISQFNLKQATGFKDGYFGMADGVGDDAAAIRTTSAGLLPYESSNATAGGICSIGTPGWYFKEAYVGKVVSNTADFECFQPRHSNEFSMKQITYNYVWFNYRLITDDKQGYTTNPSTPINQYWFGCGKARAGLAQVVTSGMTIYPSAANASSYSTTLQSTTLTGNRTATLPDATGAIPLITEIYKNPTSTATSQNITNASQYKFFIISAKLSDANHFDETTAIIPMPDATGEVRKNINFMMPVGNNTETRLLNGAIVINYSSASSCVISGMVASRYLLAGTSSSTASSISTGTMSVYITRIVGISY